MPTTVWIVEGNTDRYYEGRPNRLDACSKQAFTCKCCGKKFISSDELLQHYNFDHPLELPAIYVQGQPLTREKIIRSTLQARDVEVVQCDICHVQADGGEWESLPVPDFIRKFVNQSNSTWTVRLVHIREVNKARTEETYHIRFRIPDPNALNAVDKLFIRYLVVDELRYSHLECFETKLPSAAPVREYGSALGDYALGIILKERRTPTRAPVGFEEFAVKMRSALEVLCLFCRPVALAVTGSIRFNLNDFSEGTPPSASELANGQNFFKRICGTSQHGSGNLALLEKSNRTISAICPVDNVTARLLKACRYLVSERGISQPYLEALRQLTCSTTPISEHDLSKIHVICAEGYWSIGDKKEALTHLHAIQFDPLFKQWAQSRLEEYSNDKS